MEPIISPFPRRNRSRLSPAVLFARHHALQKGITKTNLRKTIAQKMILRRTHFQYQHYHYFQQMSHGTPPPQMAQGAEETDVEDNADEHNTEEKDNWHHASLSSGLIHPHLADSSHVPHPQQDGEGEYWGEEEETVAGDEKREEREASYLSDDAYSQDAWWTEEIEMGSQFDENELVDGGVIHYQYAYEDDEYEEEEEEEHYGEYIVYEEGDEVDREGTDALNDEEITQYLEHCAETAEDEDVCQSSFVEEKEVEKKSMDAPDAVDSAEEEDDFDGDEESEFGDEEELEDIDIDAELFTELTEADGDVDLHETGAFSLPFGDDLHILAT